MHGPAFEAETFLSSLSDILTSVLERSEMFPDSTLNYLQSIEVVGEDYVAAYEPFLNGFQTVRLHIAKARRYCTAKRPQDACVFAAYLPR